MFELRETGDWDIFRARGKRRGFSPGAAARHSQYARVYTEFLPTLSFFHFTRHHPDITPADVGPRVKSRHQPAEVKTQKPEKKTENFGGKIKLTSDG